LTPSLRVWLWDGALLPFGVEVCVADVRLELEAIADEESAVWEVDAVPDRGVVVGKWPSNHSIVPPEVAGRIPIDGMTGAAEKATVMDSESG
jgi:hypothetical protein